MKVSKKTENHSLLDV